VKNASPMLAYSHTPLPFCAVGLIVLFTASARAQEKSLEALEEQAIREAVALADPCLVRIETVGGLDQARNILFGTGPTSGIVVSPNGYIISSTFNFASKPASILVTLPDERRFPAKQIAHDKQRMLTLLKIEVDGLTPAQPAPRDSIKVGAWAIALGRTYDLITPNVSVGIVSAVNRVWGKAIQIDAKVSPVNYGGPVLDIEGRVMGVSVPLSPQASGETAGVEWYDGGIGFAIPMEDVYAVIDRLKEGKDLLPGLMGITFKPGPLGSKEETLVDRVRFASPAEKAGIKPGDRVVELDGKTIERLAHVRHVLGRKYAGDAVRVVIKRNEEQHSFDLTLAGELPPYESAFLGVVPQRQLLDPNVQGVPIRVVLPGSAAEKAGIQPRDRILKANDAELANARQLSDIVSRLRPGEELKLTWLHESAERSGTLTVGPYPDKVPYELPTEVMPLAGETPLTDDAPKTGRFTETLPVNNREFWAYVPEKYTPQANYGLVVWIHPSGDTMEASVYKTWKSLCDRRGLILLGPKAEKISGWAPLEAEPVKECVTWAQEKYRIDPQRILLHSYSNGGTFAWHLAFKYRDIFRGVAIASQPLILPLPENEPELRQQFYFVCGDQDPLFTAVKASVDGIRRAKYPVVLTTIPGLAHKYPADDDVDEIARWIDCLDRI
jgi:serine protease Do